MKRARKTKPPKWRGPPPPPSTVYTEYHLHHRDLRWITIGSPDGIEVYDMLPVNVMPPNNPQVLAVAPSAQLMPGKRVAVRWKENGQRGRAYDCVFRLVKETRKRFYIATAAGKPIPPLAKSEVEAVHAVVGVYQPERIGRARP